MCHIECPYKDKCTSHPHQCGSCQRNTGKRDYYRPRRCYDWYYPHWQWHPNTTAGDNTTGEYTWTNTSIAY